MECWERTRWPSGRARAIKAGSPDGRIQSDDQNELRPHRSVFSSAAGGLINALAKGPRSRERLAEDLDVSLASLSYHLTSLCLMGLVREVESGEGKNRSGQPDYELVSPEEAVRLSELEIPAIFDDYMLAERLRQALSEGVGALQRRIPPTDEDLRFASMTMQLDARGRKRCLEILDGVIDQLAELAAASDARVADGGDEGGLTTVFVAGIPSLRPEA